MPKILEDRRKAIARNNPNLSESSTWAIATSALQKEGKLPRHQQGGRVGLTIRRPVRPPEDPALIREPYQPVPTPEWPEQDGDRDPPPPPRVKNYCKGGKVISTRRM